MPFFWGVCIGTPFLTQNREKTGLDVNWQGTGISSWKLDSTGMGSNQPKKNKQEPSCWCEQSSSYDWWQMTKLNTRFCLFGFRFYTVYGGFHKWGTVSQNGWFIISWMEHPIKMDDLEIPPISGNLHMSVFVNPFWRCDGSYNRQVGCAEGELRSASECSVNLQH